MSKKDQIIIKGPYQDQINYSSLIKMQSEQTFGESNIVDNFHKKGNVPVKMKRKDFYKKK